MNMISLPSDVGLVRRLAHGGWWVTCQDEPQQAVVLDRRLQEVRRVCVPPSPGTAAYVVSPDGSLLAASGEDSVRVSGVDVGWSREHGSWSDFPPGLGACAFSLDGAELWATVRPGDPDGEWDEPDAGGGEDLDEAQDEGGWGDECWVLDAVTGEVLGRTSVDSEMSYSHLLAHPDGRHVAVVVSEGQDGSFGHWVRRDGNHLVKTPTDLLGRRDRSPVAVAPDGRHYLNQGWTTLSTHSFPSAELIAERRAAEVLSQGRPWNYVFGYYDASTVLATLTDNGRAASTVALRAPSLEPLGEVEYPVATRPRAVVCAGDGSWLTVEGTDVARWSLG
ncbi:hypothetical protein [Kitasatospora sp. NPDC059571]|uniref:hypothetical protein n=1 Tax=Kitasatospora sp. NPDC059571 TaxID=3346871 RepID=UPI0036991EF4